MFDSNSGLFHFVFANQDDDFYTPAYIKMKFRPYLLFQLKNSKYTHIYFWERAFDMSNDFYSLHTIGGCIIELNDQRKQNGKIFDILKRKKSNTKVHRDDEGKAYGSTLSLYIEKDKASDYFLKILKFAENNSSTAIVIPVDVFVGLCDERNFRGEISKQIISKLVALRSKRGNTNIIILTSSVNATENDKYFRNSELERGTERSAYSQENIFFHKKLFPEIRGAFDSPSTEKMPKLVFTYDLLKESMGDRVQMWNELSYYSILTAVKYALMHNMTLDKIKIYSPEMYAAIIWIWYENEKFREKYKKVMPNMPNNIFRKTKIITYIIEEQILSSEIIKEIIDRECTDDSEKLRGKWPADGKATCITYGGTEEITSAMSIIMQYLIRFRCLLRNHEHRLSDVDVGEVSALIQYFNRPNYQSSINRADLPHMLFNINDNEKAIDDALCNLEKKQEWNVWDDCSVQIFLLLFRSCRTQASQKCQVDLWNELGQVIFKKCREGLSYCLRMSKEEAYNREKACAFASNISDCINSCDKKRIKDFFI